MSRDEFIDALEASFNVSAENFSGEIFSNGSIELEKQQEAFEKYINEDWFCTYSDVLGGTPEAAVSEFFGDGFTAADASDIVKRIAVNSRWPLPDKVIKLLRDFGEEGEERFVQMLDDREAIKCSYYDSKDKSIIERQDALLSLIAAARNFQGEPVKNMLLKLFNDCPDDNEAFIEELADSLVQGFGAECVFDRLAAAGEIGARELTLMQSIVNCGQRSEEVYRCLRSCAKKSSGENKIIALSIIADYGDSRAVSFLRTVAKEYSAEFASGRGSEELKYNLYAVISMISSLGGNTDDIIGGVS